MLTSSFAAVGYTPKAPNEPYSDEDWTDARDPTLSAYVKSKTLAELAAGDFIAQDWVL